MESITGTTLLGVTKNTSGLWIMIQAPTASMTLDTTASRYAPGCICINVGDGKTYTNSGTTASPSWQNVNDITTAEISDGAVTYAKRSSVAAVTTTADGLTTGLIPAGTTFATITSDSATKFATLPAITSAGIGQTIDLYVGATGYELVTPASSNNTINTVDSDQTNQLDVAANSLVHLTQVSATGWFAYNHAATTITVVAPDND